jgi:hypothetical protein
MANLTISEVRRTLGIYSTQPITINNGGASAVQTLTSGTTVTFNIASGNWGVLDLAHNVTAFNITGLFEGAEGLIYVFQTAGSNTIVWGSMVNEFPSTGVSLLSGATELTVIGWSSADGVNVEIYQHGAINAGGGGSTSWASITGKPSTFAPSAHAHPISEVTSLQSALDGKAPTSHTHTRANITDFAHTHIIGDTSGLQAALDAKQATLVSGTTIKTVNGQSLVGSGDISVGATNKVIINSGTNTSYTYPAASMINRVVVITTSSLAAFRVGTSANGEELVADTPLDPASSNVISINFYSALSGTIYFYGITSSTTLILYYE